MPVRALTSMCSWELSWAIMLMKTLMSMLMRSPMSIHAHESSHEHVLVRALTGKTTLGKCAPRTMCRFAVICEPVRMCNILSWYKWVFPENRAGQKWHISLRHYLTLLPEPPPPPVIKDLMVKLRIYVENKPTGCPKKKGDLGFHHILGSHFWTICRISLKVWILSV